MKDGIDYFPLDIHLDDNFKLIEAEFGLTGFAVVVKLFQKIYDIGYYCEWTNDVALLFGKELGFAGDNVVSEIVRASLRRGIFNNDLYEKYQILTSKGIQTRYFEIVRRRKKIKVKKEYLLIQLDQNQKDVYIFEENVDIFTKNADISKQSKGKESKGKESKGKESKSIYSEEQVPSEPSVLQLPLNDKSEFYIYQVNVDEWKELYPKVDIMQELRKMKGWLNANPKKRKTRSGIMRFINSWLSREQDKGKAKADNDAIEDSGKYDDLAELSRRRNGML